jgi:hypothetical protein
MSAAAPEHPLKVILDNDAMPIAERVAAIDAATPDALAQQIVIPASTVMRNPYNSNNNYNSNYSNDPFRRRYKSIPTQRFTVLEYALNKAVPVELVAALLNKGIAFDRHNIMPKLFEIHSNINKNRLPNYVRLLNNNKETIRLFLERGAFANIDFKRLLNTNNDDLIMMFLHNDNYKMREYFRARQYQNLYGNPINYIILYNLNIPHTFIDFLKPLELNLGRVTYPPLSLFYGGTIEGTKQKENPPIDNIIRGVRFDLLRLYSENFPEDFERNKTIITKKLFEGIVKTDYYTVDIINVLRDLNLLNLENFPLTPENLEIFIQALKKLVRLRTSVNILSMLIDPFNQSGSLNPQIVKLILDVHKRDPLRAFEYLIQLELLEKYLEVDPEQFSKDIKNHRKLFIEFLLNPEKMPDREAATRYLTMLKPYLGLTDRNETGATFLHELARTRSPYYENVVGLARVDPTKLKNVYGMTPQSARKHYTSNILNRQINEETERRLLGYPANRRNAMRPGIRANVKKTARGGKRSKRRQTRRRSH